MSRFCVRVDAPFILSVAMCMLALFFGGLSPVLFPTAGSIIWGVLSLPAACDGACWFLWGPGHCGGQGIGIIFSHGFHSVLLFNLASMGTFYVQTGYSRASVLMGSGLVSA